MDPQTGLVLISDVRVEMGFYNGNLPVLIEGYVRLPGSIGQASLFGVNHRYLLGGVDLFDAKVYVCECGEAFSITGLALDHFLGSAFSPVPIDGTGMTHLQENYVKQSKDQGTKDGEIEDTQDDEESIVQGCKSVEDEKEENTMKDVSLDQWNDEAVKTNNEAEPVLEYEVMDVTNGNDVEDVSHWSVEHEYDTDLPPISNGCTRNELNITTDAVRSPEKKKRFVVSNQRLIMEGVFKVFGFNQGHDYRRLCAEKLGLSVDVIQEWYAEAEKERGCTNKGSIYDKFLISKRKDISRNFHKTVMKLLKTRKGSQQTSSEKLVVLEALFQEQGLTQEFRYLQICAEQVDLEFKVLNEFWTEKRKRLLTMKESPHPKYFNEEVIRKANEIHSHAKEQIENENRRMQTMQEKNIDSPKKKMSTVIARRVELRRKGSGKHYTDKKQETLCDEQDAIEESSESEDDEISSQESSSDSDEDVGYDECSISSLKGSDNEVEALDEDDNNLENDSTDVENQCDENRGLWFAARKNGEKAKLIVEVICRTEGHQMNKLYKTEITNELKIGSSCFNSYKRQAKWKEENKCPTRLSDKDFVEAKDVHRAVMGRLNKKFEQFSKYKQMLFVLQAFVKTYGCVFSVTFKNALAKKTGISVARLTERLMAYNEVNDKLAGIPEKCFGKATKLYDEICSEVPNALFISDDSSAGSDNSNLKKRIFMENLFELYKFKMSAKYRKAFSKYLSLSEKEVYEWLMEAKKNAKDNVDSPYKNKITKLMRKETRMINKEVRMCLDSKRTSNKNERSDALIKKKRLIVEALLDADDIQFDAQYKRVLANTISLSLSTITNYCAAAKNRKQLKLPNPYKRLISKNIKDEARRRHQEVQQKIEEENNSAKEKEEGMMKSKLIMECIFQKFLKSLTLNHINECAKSLSTDKYIIQNYWNMAKRRFLHKKEFRYKNLITEEISKEAEVVYEKVLKQMKD